MDDESAYRKTDPVYYTGNWQEVQEKTIEHFKMSVDLLVFRITNDARTRYTVEECLRTLYKNACPNLTVICDNTINTKEVVDNGDFHVMMKWVNWDGENVRWYFSMSNGFSEFVE